MIIIGYQGIGKSTMVLEDNSSKWIDLESSCFWNDGVRDENWYKSYVKIALDLDRQGFNVFTSSHETVRKELLKSQRTDIYVCYPCHKIKSEWIEKLRNRYCDTYDEDLKVKNYKAMMNAIDRYDANIDELKNSGFPCIEISNINYNLKYLIKDFLGKDKNN